MPLRPLGIGEIVDGGVKLIRLDVRHLWGVAAIVFAPVAIAQWWDLLDADLSGTVTDTAAAATSFFFMGSGLEGWVFPVSVVAALTVLRAFVLHSVDEVLYRRAEATVPQVLRQVPRLALASAVKALLIAIGTILAIIPGVVVASRLAVVESAVISEGTEPTHAISRSWRLTKGRIGTTLAMLTVLLLVRLGVAILLNVAAESGVFLDLQPAATRLFVVLATYGTAILVWPVSLASKALVFADLRVRKEALDLDLLIRQLDQVELRPPIEAEERQSAESAVVWAGPDS